MQENLYNWLQLAWKSLPKMTVLRKCYNKSGKSLVSEFAFQLMGNRWWCRRLFFSSQAAVASPLALPTKINGCFHLTAFAFSLGSSDTAPGILPYVPLKGYRDAEITSHPWYTCSTLIYLTFPPTSAPLRLLKSTWTYLESSHRLTFPVSETYKRLLV